jgi:hypothetical protein
MTSTTYRGARGTSILSQFVTKRKGLGEAAVAEVVTLAI